MTVTICHDLNRGPSPDTLAIFRHSGKEPEVIEYLKALPARERPVELLAAMKSSERGR